MRDDNVRAVISWNGHRDWWYLEDRSNPHICLYADDTGKFYYGQKELSRVVPLVFNDRREAFRYARIHKGRVRRFPYLLKGLRK